MSWNGEKQRELEAFLARFTSPDVAAQQLNLQQLSALAQEEGAVQALLTILTPPTEATSAHHYTLAQRTAAATTARQLLRLNPAFLHVVDLASAGQGLLAAVLVETSASLQASLCSLIAAFVKAESAMLADATATSSPSSSAVFLWALLESLSQASHAVQAQLASTFGPPQDVSVTPLLPTQVQGTLRVIRILAEDGAAACQATRLSQVRPVLCATFSAAFATLNWLTVTAAHSHDALSCSSPIVVLSTHILESLTACVASELLAFGGESVSASSASVPEQSSQAYVWDATLAALSMVVLSVAGAALASGQRDVSATLLRPVSLFTSVCVAAPDVPAEKLALLLSLVVPALQSFWAACVASQQSQVEADEEDDESVVAAVSASLTCVADIVAHVGVDVALLPALVSLLHGLVQLPTPLALALGHAHESDKATDDDPSAVLAVLQRRHADKSGGACHTDDNANENKSGDGESADDDADETVWSGFNALLPDGGARRQSVAWLLNCLAFAFPSQLSAAVIAPMVPLACADLPESAHVDPPAVANAAASVEAALFVLSEVTEEILATSGGEEGCGGQPETSLLPLLGSLAAHVVALLNRFLSTGADLGVPFFVRAGCCRWLARLLSGLEQALLTVSSVSPAIAASLWELIASLGGVPNLLEALRMLAAAETSKAAQQECLHAMGIILSGALRRSPTDVAVSRGAGAGGAMNVDTSDSDEEILDDDDAAGDQRGTPSLAFQLGLLSTSTTSPSPLFGVLCGVARDLLMSDEGQPTSSLAVRLDLYSLLSRVFPHMEMALELPGGSECVADVLGTVAQRYVRLQALTAHGGTAQSEVVVVESISILNCLCEVSASVGVRLAPACTWLVQVCGSVLLDELRGTRAAAYQHSVVTDAADRCMLALDLLSCACDALLDRDALIARTPTTPSASVDAQMSPASALASLRTAFALSQDGHTLFSLTVDVLQQALSRKPSASLASPVDGEDEADTDADLRRAAFGVLYDLVFLFSVAGGEAVKVMSGAPAMATVPMTAEHASTCAALVSLCVGELDVLVQCAAKSQSVVSHVAHSRAVSNAMLCLGETLFLLTATAEAEEAVVVTAVAPLTQSLVALQTTLITLLLDRDFFAVPVSVLQNAASAVSALACTLAMLSHHGEHAALSRETLLATIQAVAKQTKHFKPTRDHEGAFECTQLLVCLGCALSSRPDVLTSTLAHPDVAAPLGGCLSLVLDSMAGGCGGVHSPGGVMIQRSWQTAVSCIAQSTVRWGKALSLAKQQKLQRLFSTS